MRKPYGFFYGGYMNRAVLEAAGVSPENCEKGYVNGFALTIGPIANLEEKAGTRAYGLLARLSHEDYDKLYSNSPAWLKGAVYLPEAVIVHTAGDVQIPAITYICPALSGDVPDPDYVNQLADAANGLGLPQGYVAHIHSFAS